MVWYRYVVLYNNRLYMVDVEDDYAGVSVMLDDGSVWLWYWLRKNGEEFFAVEIRIGDIYDTDPLTFDDYDNVKVDIFLDMVERILKDGVVIDEREGEE